MNTVEAFEAFLGALGPGVGDEHAALIEDAFGVKCSDEAKRLLARRRAGASCGHYYALDEERITGANTFVDLLRRPMHLLGAVISAVPLGTDGGGRTYFLRLGDEEIGLYDPGLGELVYLAESVEAFGALNQAWAMFDAYAVEHDVDVEALIDGDASLDAEQPGLANLSDLLRALESKVSLPEDVDVISDFTDLGSIAGPFESEAETSLSGDVTRAWWLTQALGQRGLRAADLEAADPAPAEFADISDALYGLWHGFFVADEGALGAILSACEGHGARLVRDAAAFISNLERGGFAQFGYVGAARDLAHAKLMPEAVAETPTKEHPFLQEDDGSEAIQKLVAELRERPALANRWDQLAFHLFNQERWLDMKEVAKASIAIEPQSYYPWMQLGIALSQLESLHAAIRAFDVGLALEWNNANLWYNKAGCLVELGEHGDAITHLELVHPEGRRDMILAIGDFGVLEGNPRFDALMSE